MNRIARSCVFLLITVVAACSKDMSPQERVTQFLETSDYHLLSEEDRKVWSKNQWSEISNAHQLKPRLLPTNKYYELEQYLYSFVTFEISEVVAKDDYHVVGVRIDLPKVLDEVSAFSDYGLKYKVEEIRNLQTLFESGRLTPSSIETYSFDAEYTVYATGIFIDLETIQETRDIKSSIDSKFDKLSSVEEYIPNLQFGMKDSWHNQVYDLRKIGIEKVVDDISLYSDAIKYAKEKDASFWLYTKLENLANLHKSKIILDSDALFQRNLIFENVRIAETASNRGLGLFFDWLYIDTAQTASDLRAAYIVKFFDKNGTQIGSEIVHYSSINLEEGNRGGSVGRKIENQNMAARTDYVEIFYYMPYGNISVTCEYDEILICS